VPRNYIPVERDQQFLMPLSMRDWLRADHLAWFVLDAVGQMDLSAFYARHREDGWGRAAFEPSMMVALLFYAYAVGVRSSREIERRCVEDIAFRIIAANHRPDHSTICRFINLNERALSGLFSDVLRLCVEAGLVRVGVLAIDGTKMGANAAHRNNRTAADIDREIAGFIAEIKTNDGAEDRLHGPDKRGDELPPELVDRQSRIERLRRAKAELDARAAAEQRAYEQKIAEREEHLRHTGKKKDGRKPRPPDPKQQQRRRINTTDPDSRPMPHHGSWMTGYNAQIVATEDQIIIASDLSQRPGDMAEFVPMLTRAHENLSATGVPTGIGTVVADAGYFTPSNCRAEIPQAPDLIFGVDRTKETPRTTYWGEDFTRMRERLATEEGRALYDKRGRTVEPIFGQIKEARRAQRFMRRGLVACATEWSLLTASHNLLKIWRAQKARLSHMPSFLRVEFLVTA
jgi:transposase